MVVVVAALGILLAIVFSLLQNAYIVKNRIQARQSVIQGMYYLYEKINQYSQDYTIDYEEYRDRAVVGCDSTDMGRDVGENGKCDRFTAYGNYNSIPTLWSYDRHGLYYCSSTADQLSPDYVIQSNDILNAAGCTDTAILIPTEGIYYQSYGEYALQFLNVRNDVSGFGYGAVGDADDQKMWNGPAAITDSGVQEIYLIKNDDTQRLYIRRHMIESGDRNGDNQIDLSEQHYVIEILRLIAIDAGNKHTQDNTDDDVADGTIDTRACDASQWFVCTGTPVGEPYTDMRLPANTDDGRVQLTEDDISITDRSIQINPPKDPTLATQDTSSQISPYITITTTAAPYAKIRQRKLWLDVDLMKYAYTIQTTFAVKTVYTQ